MLDTVAVDDTAETVRVCDEDEYSFKLMMY